MGLAPYVEGVKVNVVKKDSMMMYLGISESSD